MYPLDEVQENINLWTKRILLGPDELSCRLHTPNVSATHMCVNHEETEYIKSTLDYNDIDNIKQNNTHRSKRGDVPFKTVEKTRLYEWYIVMFKEHVPGRECMVKYGYSIINQLKTKLSQDINKNTTDSLENCISDMFSDKESIELEEYDEIDLEVIPIDVIESIQNDYTTYNIADFDTTNDSNTQYNKERSVLPLAIKNVFTEGRKK